MDILIASHGTLAQGVQSAVNIIVGDNDTTIINAYVDESNFKEVLKEYFANHDEVCVLTDLFGGSVNQEIMQYMKGKNIHVITGVNLSLALEIILTNKNDVLTEEKIMQIIEVARQQILYINKELENQVMDDFD